MYFEEAAAMSELTKRNRTNAIEIEVDKGRIEREMSENKKSEGDLEGRREWRGELESETEQ